MDWQLCLVLSIVALATLVRAMFGFGEALIAMPLLTIAIGLSSSAPLMAMFSISSTMVLLWYEWRNLNFRRSWPIIVAALIGIPFGQFALDWVPDRFGRLGLATIVVVFAGYGLAKPGLLTLKSDNWGPVFGFVAGVLSGAYNTAGPPLVIYGTMRQWCPDTFRNNLQSIFLPLALAVVAGHVWAGACTPELVRYWLYSLPIAIGTAIVGIRLGRRIPRQWFIPIIHLMLLAIGTFMFMQAIR